MIPKFTGLALKSSGHRKSCSTRTPVYHNCSYSLERECLLEHRHVISFVVSLFVFHVAVSIQ